VRRLWLRAAGAETVCARWAWRIRVSCSRGKYRSAVQSGLEAM
jgi:hypothetical protein